MALQAHGSLNSAIVSLFHCTCMEEGFLSVFMVFKENTFLFLLSETDHLLLSPDSKILRSQWNVTFCFKILE